MPDAIQVGPYPIAYDGFGRPLRTTFADGSYEELGYDPQGLGLVTSRRLRDGQTLGFGYDDLGRRLSMTVPGGSNAGHVSYTYDNHGALLSASETPGHAARFSYDALGRKTGEPSLAGGVSLQYDAGGGVGAWRGATASR